MRNVRRTLTAAPCAALALIAVLLVAGCGSSKSTSSSANQTGNAVARAANVTAGVPGYRTAATINLTGPTGQSTMTEAGTFDRASRSGMISAQQTVVGHHLKFTVVFSGLTFYWRNSGIPALSKLTGGKPWVKFDMSRLLGSLGLGSLPTSGGDPAQFVDYLRAVRASTTKLGTVNVRGISTTHYHAVVDLSNYIKLVSPADRAAASRSVKALEQALGGKTLPIDVYVDNTSLVRRISFGYSECVSGQRMRLSMTMDLYDYGPKPPPQLPSANDAYDLTPLLTSTLGKVKFGCSSTA
jgi:hypothetical protein